MTHDELEKLFCFADDTNEAVSKRLIAARKATGLQQQEIAAAVGIPKQTYNSQEKRGAPSIRVGRYFYRAHRMDFNYLFYGDFLHLDEEVRERLVHALSDEPA